MNNPNTNGLARLFRFVDNLPEGVISEYDESNNLLRINKELFEALSPEQQKWVKRTHDRYIVLTKTIEAREEGNHNEVSAA